MTERANGKIQLRSAGKEDVDLLVVQRLRFTRISEADPRYAATKENLYRYFEKAFSENTCDVIQAEQDGVCIGTGIIFYYDSVPSSFNPEGRNAYVTSLYVEPEYRRQGIGSQILESLIQKAKERRCPVIMLNATEMGKPLYRKRGFSDIQNGMILDVRSENET